MYKDYGIYILCGGNSSRMGKDKATFKLNEKTFLEHIRVNLHLKKNDVILVSDKLAHRLDGYHTIKDVDENCGPLGGIVSALNHSTKKMNLILSCDIPFIDYESLKFIENNINLNAHVNIPVVDGRLMPLIGFYSKESLGVFQNQLKNKILKLLLALDKSEVNKITIPTHLHKNFSNINSLEDLKKMTQ